MSRLLPGGVSHVRPRRPRPALCASSTTIEPLPIAGNIPITATPAALLAAAPPGSGGTLSVTFNGTRLNLRDEPTTQGATLGKLPPKVKHGDATGTDEPHCRVQLISHAQCEERCAPFIDDLQALHVCFLREGDHERRAARSRADDRMADSLGGAQSRKSRGGEMVGGSRHDAKATRQRVARRSDRATCALSAPLHRIRFRRPSRG